MGRWEDAERELEGASEGYVRILGAGHEMTERAVGVLGGGVRGKVRMGKGKGGGGWGGGKGEEQRGM